MNIAITKMSSKGQIVIPAEMRADIEEGDKIMIIQNKDQWVMKKATKLDSNFEKDLEFAKQTEEAWKSYKKGEFKSMKSEEFLSELEKW